MKERALRVLEHTELNIVFETEQRKIHLSKTKEKWIWKKTFSPWGFANIFENPPQNPITLLWMPLYT